MPREIEETHVGPIGISHTIARRIGWTEKEIEEASKEIFKISRRYTRAAAKRKGKTAFCTACEQHAYPKEKGGCEWGCNPTRLAAKKPRRYP